MQFDRVKFKAMIHYIADAVPRAMLGKVRLNKILWFSDREMYLQTGKTISGETYLKYPQGPISENILTSCEELADERKIAVRKSRYFQHEQYEYISLQEPDIQAFTAQEIDIISRMILMVTSMSASEVSDFSHGRAWLTTEFGKEIPMFSVLAENTRELTPDDAGWIYKEMPPCQ